MADEFFLKPEEYVQHAKTLGVISDKLKAAERQLATLLSEEGKCWGDDPTGRAFEEPYSEKGSTVVDNSTAGATHLSNLSHTMSWAAQQSLGRDANIEHSIIDIEK